MNKKIPIVILSILLLIGGISICFYIVNNNDEYAHIRKQIKRDNKRNEHTIGGNSYTLVENKEVYLFVHHDSSGKENILHIDDEAGVSRNDTGWWHDKYKSSETVKPSVLYKATVDEVVECTSLGNGDFYYILKILSCDEIHDFSAEDDTYKSVWIYMYENDLLNESQKGEVYNTFIKEQ